MAFTKILSTNYAHHAMNIAAFVQARQIPNVKVANRLDFCYKTNQRVIQHAPLTFLTI
jgi:hypothetical protein